MTKRCTSSLRLCLLNLVISRKWHIVVCWNVQSEITPETCACLIHLSIHLQCHGTADVRKTISHDILLHYIFFLATLQWIATVRFGSRNLRNFVSANLRSEPMCSIRYICVSRPCLCLLCVYYVYYVLVLCVSMSVIEFSGLGWCIKPQCFWKLPFNKKPTWWYYYPLLNNKRDTFPGEKQYLS